MPEKIKHEITNLWLSDECAKSNCADCAEKKVLPQTIHLCYCNCHSRRKMKIKFVAPVMKSRKIHWW